jgi:hypothetical protein
VIFGDVAGSGRFFFLFNEISVENDRVVWKWLDADKKLEVRLWCHQTWAATIHQTSVIFPTDHLHGK